MRGPSGGTTRAPRSRMPWRPTPTAGRRRRARRAPLAEAADEFGYSSGQPRMASPAVPGNPERPKRGGAAAMMVAAGIFLSRVAGLVRTRVFAHYFGASDTADAFNAAFRIPNFLQNLFGEGVLSASFIPVYANLLARGDEREA